MVPDEVDKVEKDALSGFCKLSSCGWPSAIAVTIFLNTVCKNAWEREHLEL